MMVTTFRSTNQITLHCRARAPAHSQNPTPRMVSVSLRIKGRQREQAPLHPRNMPITKGPDNSIAHPQLDAPNPIYRRRTAVPKMHCPTHLSVPDKQLLVRTHVKSSTRVKNP